MYINAIFCLQNNLDRNPLEEVRQHEQAGGVVQGVVVRHLRISLFRTMTCVENSY